MANFLDYLYWRGDLTMDCAPMNPVDGLILAWFSVMPLKNPLPETLGEAASAIGEALEEDNLRFVKALSQSRRFRDMRLLRFESRFSEEEQMQFAALAVEMGDGTAFAAYRGTDSTLVGWKEDFNMSFIDEVPAQREAVRYLDEIARMTDLPLRVGGHSKGGNLAVYASARCAPQTRSRILQVYNYDGPGLSAAVMESPEYAAVEGWIGTWLPQSSIVGILLERTSRYHVVRSDNFGPWQHDPASWQVTPDNFELLDELGWESLYADRTLRDWLGQMSAEEKRTFVNALYEIVESTQAKTVEEVGEDWQRSGWAMLSAFHNLDLRTKALLFLALGRLIRAAVQNMNQIGR